jgi:trigger factor
MSPDAFAKAVDEADQVQSFVAEVARRKALAVALEQATVKDASGNVVDLEALQPQQEQPADTTDEAAPASEDTEPEASTDEAETAPSTEAADPEAAKA